MFVGRVELENTPVDKKRPTALVEAGSERQTCSKSRFE